ncbi:MAG TPA: hypothetical protein DCY42_02540 [Chloroflexi bacterium]|nr:hypothetical protein [Chloroflexota bacterium]
MKYEEWIKYEELRKKMFGSNPWVILEPKLFTKSRLAALRSNQHEKPRILSAILQVFNSRSI